VQSEDNSAIAAAILDKNKTYREDALRLIESHEAIAFAGAGLSAPLYPTWLPLLRKVAEEAKTVTGAPFTPPRGVTELDALNYAEALQQHYRARDATLSQYYSIIGREFSGMRGRCTDQQRNLVRLPFKGFVTTNFDDGLEEALLDCGIKRANCGIVVKRDEDHHTISEFLISLDDANQARRVAHLHGSWRETRHIILSRSDYELAYGGVRPDRAAPSVRADEWPLHRRLVWALLATRRIIFVGTSLQDPYLRALVRTVAEDLWNAGQSIHYAIVPLDGESIRRQHNDESEFIRYGVRTVYYDNLNGSFQALDQLISEALGRCGLQNDRTWLESINVDTERTLRRNED
jgi:hypothetical protein